MNVSPDPGQWLGLILLAGFAVLGWTRQRQPRSPKPGERVLIRADHPQDFWDGAAGQLLADFGTAGQLVSYRQRGEELILAAVPREAWEASPIGKHARPDILVCGTVVLDKRSHGAQDITSTKGGRRLWLGS